MSSSARDNPMTWSLRIGSVFRISVRLHLLFLLGAIYLIFSSSRDDGLRGALYGAGAAFMLFFLVLLHEFGHCWGARRSGGEADEVLLWPLGGLASVRPRHTPHAHLVTTLAGPAVNAILGALAASILITLGGSLGAVPWNPLHPFDPVDPSAGLYGPAGMWLRIFFGLNYVMVLFNLLPMYPMDGGRVLHAILWPRKGIREATLTATFVGMVGAVAFGLLGFMTEEMLLVALAMFGYLTCYMERQAAKHGYLMEREDELGYDFSKGYAAFEDEPPAEPAKPGFFKRRKLARQAARAARAAAEEARLRERVDEILAKVHKQGLKSLTAEERRILEKETERQRAAGS